MKVRQYINMMGMAAAVLLSSCVKDTLYDTPHPDKGAVTISLTGLSSDDNYVLDKDGKVADTTGFAIHLSRPAQSGNTQYGNL